MAIDTDKLRAHSPYIGMHRITMPQCPPCHGQCHQGRACNAKPEPSFYGSGYGEEIAPMTPAQPVPCSTLARWWLAFKRGL